MKTQNEVRKNFWAYLQEVSPELYLRGKRSKGQNEQVTDVRVHFTDYLYNLFMNGNITEKQYENYTL